MKLYEHLWSIPSSTTMTAQHRCTPQHLTRWCDPEKTMKMVEKKSESMTETTPQRHRIWLAKRIVTNCNQQDGHMILYGIYIYIYNQHTLSCLMLFGSQSVACHQQTVHSETRLGSSFSSLKKHERPGPCRAQQTIGILWFFWVLKNHRS